MCLFNRLFFLDVKDFLLIFEGNILRYFDNIDDLYDIVMI